MTKRLVIGLLAMVLMIGFSTMKAPAATKDDNTGRYVFSEWEKCPTEKYFQLDPKARRYVDIGYQAFMANSKAASATLAAQNEADRAYWKNWRRAAMYFPVTTTFSVVFECAEARAVEWAAADSWLLKQGKPAPWGCATYSGLLGGAHGLVSVPNGPAFSLLWGPFCGFSGELDPITAAGRNSSLLFTAARGAMKGVMFTMALDSPGVFFDRVASPPLHNAFAWAGMSTIPGDILASAGLFWKGVPYSNLLKYQNSDLNTGNCGVNFDPSVKANTKKAQILF